MKKKTRIATRKSKSQLGSEHKEALKRIGRTIKAIRSLRGFTQSELAELVRASQNHISNIEKGNREPGILFLLAIAKSLGVSIDLLVLSAMEKALSVDDPADSPTSQSHLRNLIFSLLDEVAST